MTGKILLRPAVRLILLGTLLLACGISLSVDADRVAGEGGRMVQPKIAIKAQPFSLKQVRLLDSPFRDAMERDRKYLLSLDPDRLLHMFRITAGLPSSAQPYGGWEKPDVELRGHSMGHYLSGCALMYASTGDEKLKQKADAIVAELATCQRALAGNGYLSAYPEEFIERVETGRRVWAPWYTLHKIYAGLLDMYLHCDNRQALEVAIAMAAWARQRIDRLSDEQMQRVLSTEFGGMNEVLRNLYAVTDDEKLLALARRFDHKAILDPLAQRRDRLKGLHVNTQIPKIIGAARAYELTGERYYYDVATYFWNEVTGTRSYATGGTSNDELWRAEPYQIACELGPEAHETCCTYNMLKLTRHLFGWNPISSYADYYERALLNGILSTQNPEDGMVMYYVSMAPGMYKTFMDPTNSFWCCTGTGMENHAKYGDSIYFHDDRNLYVNLYIASELQWPEKGVRIRQETRFPEQQATALVFRAGKPVELSVNIRVPGWMKHHGGGARLNGKQLESFSNPGSYFSLRRTWKDGDRIEIDLPMSLRLERTPDNPNTAAILYGPLVMAGQLGGALPAEKVFGPMGPSGEPANVPYFVADTGDLSSWIKPSGSNPLAFRTVGAGRPADISLIPFYQLFGQRYSIYWNIYSQSEWSAIQAFDRSLPAGTIDRLAIGDPTSNADHHYHGYATRSGEESGRNWVSSTDWFAYDMKVLPDQAVVLYCAFLGSDEGLDFEVEIDRHKMRHDALIPAGTGEIREHKYSIPLAWTQGKKQVNVTFRAIKGKSTGRLVACSIAKE